MDDINIEQLMDEAKEDLTFNETNVERRSLAIPLLTEKYARKMVYAKAALKKAEMALNNTRLERREYYTTTHSTRVDRRDMDEYISGDRAYTEKQAIYEINKLKVEYIQSILDALDKASWNIGNAIKMIIYKGGGD